MDTYHGTSSSNATVLASGSVDVTLGGGELGRGFYTGEQLYLAKAWAFHHSGDKQRNVVRFSTPDTEIETLWLKLLDYRAASLRRSNIKQRNVTRTFLFHRDMIWASIVGSDRVSGDQYKWESSTAQTLLNGSNTLRDVI